MEGGCNRQFALNLTPEYVVTGGQPLLLFLRPGVQGHRLSIAKVVKIALGYTLDEIPNAVTGKTTACFEPTLTIAILKIPCPLIVHHRQPYPGHPDEGHCESWLWHSLRLV